MSIKDILAEIMHNEEFGFFLAENGLIMFGGPCGAVFQNYTYDKPVPTKEESISAIARSEPPSMLSDMTDTIPS